MKNQSLQLTLDIRNSYPDSLWKGQTSIDERGAIYTRVEVVEFILDLVGYTDDKPLYQYSLLEPSIGDGDFLVPVIRRLVKSWQKFSDSQNASKDLWHCITGVELHPETFQIAIEKVRQTLIEEGLNPHDANLLAEQWLIRADYLLANLPKKFDFIVGNPPYVRQELIPNQLTKEYRRRFKSFYDRADLYVPFIEQSLDLLNESGELGFICSDRWMKNRYGGPLREIISDGFHLKYHINMVDTSAFQSDVSAYTAVTVISRKTDRTLFTFSGNCRNIDKAELDKLSSALKGGNGKPANDVHRLSNVTKGNRPWMFDSSARQALLSKLEETFPIIEEAGCKVGIGVATGADSVFIVPYNSFDVEPDRIIPIVRTKDIENGSISWKGMGVLNPFNNDGSLIDLKNYPRLESHFKSHQDLIKKRHVASKNPNNWYRTIDRIHPDLRYREKLLIPDIKEYPEIVYDDGQYYPHHNLYFVTSGIWNLKILQAILKSEVTNFFISMYSTKMRGGYLRFQAQYLRRIRIPYWTHVTEELREKLLSAMAENNIDLINKAVFELYNLDSEEQTILKGKE